MMFHPTSWAALVIIAAGLVLAGRGRFTAALCLVLANVLVHVLGVFGSSDGVNHVKLELALDIRNLDPVTGLGVLQFVTSMFVHFDFWHLVSNVIVLLFFALPFEERIGPNRFLSIYLLSGLVASLAQVLVGMDGAYRLMGASGAVFGIIGAFAAAYPNLRVALPIPLPFFMPIVPMRVWVGAGLFALMQVLYLFVLRPDDNVAYVAHLGGLFIGLFLGMWIHRTRPARTSVAVDLRLLQPFARDSRTDEALKQMDANRDEPQVFQAWLDRFFRSARCPTCNNEVLPRHHGEVVCRLGHRFDVRSRQPQPVGKAI